MQIRKRALNSSTNSSTIITRNKSGKLNTATRLLVVLLVLLLVVLIHVGKVHALELLVVAIIDFANVVLEGVGADLLERADHGVGGVSVRLREELEEAGGVVLIDSALLALARALGGGGKVL